jgi:diadenosine tetraphosphatase ApaH/serine/threonine PP2A family protein phosphatase
VPYLILSDIHANREALAAVLEDARGMYDQILCLGDLVGYGAEPNEIVDWARENCTVVIRGNHDRSCSNEDEMEAYNAAAQLSVLWTRAALTEANRDYLFRLPRGPVPYEGLDLVHGSPADEDEYVISLPDVDELRPLLFSPTTFFGHTHVQGGFLLTRLGTRRIDPRAALEVRPYDRYLLNPGSVGQPRDRDPRAAYALYHPEERMIEFRRVAYDVESAANKIVAAGLPPLLAARLYEGR